MNKTFEEVRAVVKKAKPFTIVKGPHYLYFCVQPTQEQIVFQQILKKKNMSIIAIYNYRDSIIGYLTEFVKKPKLDISDTADGAAIFFTSKMAHEHPQLIYSDSKLRVLSFDNEDFFVAVKWKSMQDNDSIEVKRR